MLQGAIMETRSNMGFQHSRLGNYTVISLIWPDFELFRDFMPVLVICKFEENLIKNEDDYRGDNSFTIISIWDLFQHPRANNSTVNSPIRQKIELF